MAVKYLLNPEIRYYVNISGIQLDDKKGHVVSLDYPEAAVFDLLLKKLPDEKIISMLSKIYPGNSSDPVKIFSDTVDLLVKHKIIITDHNIGKYSDNITLQS